MATAPMRPLWSGAWPTGTGGPTPCAAPTPPRGQARPRHHDRRPARLTYPAVRLAGLRRRERYPDWDRGRLRVAGRLAPHDGHPIGKGDFRRPEGDFGRLPATAGAAHAQGMKTVLVTRLAMAGAALAGLAGGGGPGARG